MIERETASRENLGSWLLSKHGGKALDSMEGDGTFLFWKIPVDCGMGNGG